MKKLGRILALALLLAALAAGAGVVYLKTAFPKVPPAPDIQVAATPARLERGSYLANHVAVCIDCHSARDWTRFAGPVKEGTIGQGGERFDRTLGFPGVFFARNITPAGIGDWTDGELLRAFTAGVDRRGEPLFPMMPYPRYATLSREDAYSIVAYLRTLKPIAHEVPAPRFDFPMNLILRTIPKAASLRPGADEPGEAAYGAYLANTAACTECHTQKRHGEPVEGMELAGGFAFPLPNGWTVRSSNITPDPETGIGGWTRELFISRFKSFANPSSARPVGPQEPNTIMPWTRYAGMTDKDLGAIYAYLRTIRPVRNPVQVYSR